MPCDEHKKELTKSGWPANEQAQEDEQDERRRNRSGERELERRKIFAEHRRKREKSQQEETKDVDDLGPIKKLTETSQPETREQFSKEARRQGLSGNELVGYVEDRVSGKSSDEALFNIRDRKEGAETSQDNMDKKATETPNLEAVIKKKEEEDKHPGTIENMPEETSGKRIFEESVANLQKLSAEAEAAQEDKKDKERRLWDTQPEKYYKHLKKNAEAEEAQEGKKVWTLRSPEGKTTTTKLASEVAKLQDEGWKVV